MVEIIVSVCQQPTAVRLNQKQTEQGTERHSHVKTTPTQTTSYGGPGRGTGEDHGKLGRQCDSSCKSCAFFFLL